MSSNKKHEDSIYAAHNAGQNLNNTHGSSMKVVNMQLDTGRNKSKDKNKRTKGKKYDGPGDQFEFNDKIEPSYLRKQASEKDDFGRKKKQIKKGDGTGGSAMPGGYEQSTHSNNVSIQNTGRDKNPNAYASKGDQYPSN